MTKTNEVATLAEVKQQLHIDGTDYDTELSVFMNEAKHIIETRLSRSLDDCVYKVKYCLRSTKENDWLELLLALVASVSVHGTTKTETIITSENGINSALEWVEDYGTESTFTITVIWGNILERFQPFFFLFVSHLFRNRDAMYPNIFPKWPQALQTAFMSSFSPWIRKTQFAKGMAIKTATLGR